MLYGGLGNYKWVSLSIKGYKVVSLLYVLQREFSNVLGRESI